MSERLGPIRYGESDELVFLGREISERRNYSDKVAQQIDEEVKALVDQARARCTELLRQNWDKLELVTQFLLEVETINAEQFEAIMRGEDPFPDTGGSPGPKPQSSGRTDEATAGSGERADGGLDLGGRLPAPA